MADEDEVFKPLHVLPCDPKDYNKGRCRLDIKTMKSLGLIIGSPIRIKTSNKYVYCNAWPHSQNSCGFRFVQFDDLITSPLINNTSLLIQCLPMPEGIMKLQPQGSTCVTVSVLLNDIGNSRNNTSRLYENQLERRLALLLKDMTFTKGCLVKPRNYNNQSTLLKNISSVIIEDIQPYGDCTNYYFSENTKIKFKSIKMAHCAKDSAKSVMAGLDEASQVLKEMLSYPFDYPESFAHIGLECPKGILLQGGPGVGKTLLVKNITTECNAQLITLNGTDVFGPHSGESEENLRKTFEKAW